MTVARVLTRPMTLEYRAATAATDKYGNPISGTVDTDDVHGYFEQTDELEVIVGQDTYTSTGLLVLAPRSRLQAWDRVVIDGDRWEVIGPPRRPWRPSTGEHHVEARLRRSAEG